MNESRLLHSAWIPPFWAALAMLCWLLPSAVAESWGLLAQSWYWLLLAVLCNRWQHLNAGADRSYRANRRRRPAATRGRPRRSTTTWRSGSRSA